MKQILFSLSLIIFSLSYSQYANSQSNGKGGADVGTGIQISNFNRSIEVPAGNNLYKSFPIVGGRIVSSWCLTNNGATLRSKKSVQVCTETRDSDGVPECVSSKKDYVQIDRSRAVPVCASYNEMGSDAYTCNYQYQAAPDTYLVRTLEQVGNDDGIPVYQEVSRETYKLEDCAK